MSTWYGGSILALFSIYTLKQTKLITLKGMHMKDDKK